MIAPPMPHMARSYQDFGSSGPGDVPLLLRSNQVEKKKVAITRFVANCISRGTSGETPDGLIPLAMFLLHRMRFFNSVFSIIGTVRTHNVGCTGVPRRRA